MVKNKLQYNDVKFSLFFNAQDIEIGEASVKFKIGLEQKVNKLAAPTAPPVPCPCGWQWQGNSAPPAAGREPRSDALT